MDLGRSAERIRFVLADPSIPANIGAAARALKTMGFSNLWVSNPRVASYRGDPDAVRLATQAADVLRESRSASSLAEALSGVRFAWAVSGYDHEFGPRIFEVTEAADLAAGLVLDELEPGDVAFVFGTERDGLSNDEVSLCQAIAAIPADSAMPSLNLAQAVQVVAWEARRSVRASLGEKGLLDWETRFPGGVPASPAELDGFCSHLERSLAAVGMTQQGDRGKIVPRIRSLVQRGGATKDDIVLLRAVCAAMEKPRAARPLAAKAAPDPDGRWKAGRAR